MDKLYDAPDFYVEITSELFNSSSNDVYQQEYLHQDWKTKHVYRIHPTLSYVYLLYDLHKNPHYHLQKQNRDKFNTKAKEQNIPVVNVCKPIYSINNEIHFISNEADIYKNQIQPLTNQIQFTNIITLLDKMDVCKRGNIAHNIGWHTLSFQFQGQINIPTHSNITKLDSDTLLILTSCYFKAFQTTVKPLPFTTNNKRSLEFANELVRYHDNLNVSSHKHVHNVFESMTYAMTYLNQHPNILKPHIDALNCAEYGFNAVFGMVFILPHPTKTNQYVRLVILGYSRKSINDYYKRLNKRHLLKCHLRQYYSMLKNRKYFTLNNAIPWSNRNRNKDNFVQRLPFIDKCGFYSIFVSCLHDLLQVHRDTICLDHVVELVLPIGWLTTGVHYYQVIKKFEKLGLPNSNLSFEIIDGLLQLGHTISSGIGPRMQPYANKGIESIDMYKALQHLKRIIIRVNTAKTIDVSTILQEVSNGIKYVGYVGAQHILSILTLLGVIHCPMFVRDSIVLPKSRTEKRIKQFYSLSPKLINILYKDLANECFDGSTRFVENLVCEFFRDIKDPLSEFNENTYMHSIKTRTKGNIRFPDTFVNDQSIFVEKSNVITRYYYDDVGNVKSMLIKKLILNETQVLNWNPNEIKNVYKPFVNSSNSNTVKKRNHDPTLSQSISEHKRQKLLCLEDNVLNDVDGYPEVQYKVIQMLNNQRNPHSIKSFDMNNNWFEGVYRTFNSIQTFQSIVCPKRKKTKRSKKKVIEFHSITDNDSGTYYTASSRGSNKVIYLSSNSSNIYMQGFYKWHPNIFSTKKRDLFAYYETKEQAKLALIVKGFVDDVKLNIYNSGNLSNFIQGISNNIIALFEKRNKDGFNFFGVISKEQNQIKLLVPIDKENELWSPWQVFTINT